MNNFGSSVKNREIEVANKLVNFRTASLLQDLKFDWPVLDAWHVRQEQMKSDGTYFFRNIYGSELSRPTYGMAVLFLQVHFGIYESLYHGDGEGRFEKWQNDFQETLEKLVTNKKNISKKEDGVKEMKNDIVKETIAHKNKLIKELRESEKLLELLKEKKKAKKVIKYFFY